MVWAGIAQAQAQAILDPPSLPGVDAPTRQAYADWLLTNEPRVFALGSNGKMGWFAGGKSLDEARARAVQLCTDHGGVACQPYAENLAIVWPGRAWQAPKPPGPLVETWNYGFVPDDAFLWHGPSAARGVVVWSVGFAFGVDLRGVQSPPYLRAFNDAGFDIIRAERAPNVDNPVRAAGWLRDELPVLRRSGYRTVVAAGDSRGGWTSLQILDTPGLADAVIAIAPAAHGSGASPNLTAQDDDMRALISEAAPSAARVAVVEFAADPFVSDTEVQVALLGRLRAKVAALLLLDRPAGFTGHSAGTGSQFSLRYGPCLLRFVIDPAPPPSCSAPQ